MQAGGVRAVDVSGQPWLDVDTQQAVAEAERRICASLSKGSDDGYVSEHFNRKISRAISMVLVRTPITPDQISVASFLLGLLGAVFLALAGSFWWLAGGVIIQAASILDGCDGEVARLKRRESARGAWLDTVLDRYSDLAVALAVTYAHAASQEGAWIWVAGFLSAAGFVLASYVTKEFHLRFGSPYPNNWMNRIKRRDLRILLISLGAIAGHPFVGLLLAGGLSHLAVFGILGFGWVRGARSVE
jgi:CDP-L-myo-inositol myo-inositolphosphotransferase